MSARPSLWIPGPTEVRPELLAVLAEPMIGHRTPELEGDIAALDPGLAALFGVTDPAAHHVAVHSATATALMELGLRAVGPRVLALVNGAFSRRFAEIAEALGKEVTVLESPPGAPADLEGAAELLGAGAPFDGVTVCASETSTGILTAPARIGAALAPGVRRGARLLVDVVTLLGAGPVDVTANGIDFALAGTQKALALPPGLGLLAISDGMLRAAPPSGSYFLDAALIVETHRARKPPMTPTIPLVRALRAQLDTIAEGTLERRLHPDGPADLRGLALRFDRHRAMAARVRAFAEEVHGVRVFGRAGAATSPTVTCLEVGEGRVSGALAACAAAGFTIGAGYGALRGSTVRIGHMGDHDPRALERLLDALAAGLTA